MTALVRAGVDVRTMVGREVRRSVRSIDSLLTSLIMPVMILTMFVFVFGGAIDTTGRYINYVVPGIILLCAGFGAASTAVSVAQDRHEGVVDRFRTLPIFATSVLIGHVLASVIRNLAASTLVLGFALLYGFRPSASLTEWLAAIALLAVFIVAFTWIACAVGLVVGAEAASGLTFVMLFLPYVSSGFVPTATMPVVLQRFAEHQPLTPIIEAMRGLLMGSPAPGDIVTAVVWCLAVMAIGYGLAVVAFRRRPAD